MYYMRTSNTDLVLFNRKGIAAKQKDRLNNLTKTF